MIMVKLCCWLSSGLYFLMAILPSRHFSFFCYLYLISESKPIKIFCHFIRYISLSWCHLFFLIRPFSMDTASLDWCVKWIRQSTTCENEGAHRAENKTSIKRKSINFFVLFSHYRLWAFGKTEWEWSCETVEGGRFGRSDSLKGFQSH